MSIARRVQLGALGAGLILASLAPIEMTSQERPGASSRDTTLAANEGSTDSSPAFVNNHVRIIGPALPPYSR